jgi:hypothetical protein
MNKILIGLVVVLFLTTALFAGLWVREKRSAQYQSLRYRNSYDNVVKSSKKIEKAVDAAQQAYLKFQNDYNVEKATTAELIADYRQRLITTKIALARQYQAAQKYSPYDDSEVMEAKADLLLLEALALQKGLPLLPEN